MALAPALPSNLFTVPYLTIDEYKRAPTGVDLHGISGSTSEERDQELANVIARASGLVNVICKQNLAATTDIEQGRVRMDRSGEIFVATYRWPIIEVTELQVGSSPSNMAAVSLDEIFIEHSSFTVAQASLGLGSSQGPLQFSAVRPTTRAFAKWTYTNGWPCTTFRLAASSGAATLPLVNVDGIHTGTELTIYDGERTETVIVTGEPSGGNVPVTTTTEDHDAGINISSLPPAVKEAAILTTSALIKLRGNQAMVMRAINDSEPKSQNKDEPGFADITSARWILTPFMAFR